MKNLIMLIFAIAVLFCTSVFADANEQAGFILFLDAGVPLKGAEGRYGADFGKSFLNLAVQARLAGNFYVEGLFSFYPEPRPGGADFYGSNGFELTLDGLWKFSRGKRITPFVKVGVSYAYITYRNAYAEIYYPDAGRQIDRWLGLNAGAGIECQLSDTLLLRLGGVFTLVPNDGEGAVASWGKLFAGLGFKL